LLHEGLAPVAFFVFGVNVAGFHFALLGCWLGLGTPTLFHEACGLVNVKSADAFDKK
jgi:hypothetical protein